MSAAPWSGKAVKNEPALTDTTLIIDKTAAGGPANKQVDLGNLPNDLSVNHQFVAADDITDASGFTITVARAGPRVVRIQGSGYSDIGIGVREWTVTIREVLVVLATITGQFYFPVAGVTANRVLPPVYIPFVFDPAKTYNVHVAVGTNFTSNDVFSDKWSIIA